MITSPWLFALGVLLVTRHITVDPKAPDKAVDFILTLVLSLAFAGGGMLCIALAIKP